MLSKEQAIEILDKILVVAFNERPSKKWFATHDNARVEVYHSLYPIHIYFGTLGFRGIRISPKAKPHGEQAVHDFATALRDAANLIQAVTVQIESIRAKVCEEKP